MKSEGFYTLQGCARTIGHAEIWCVPIIESTCLSFFLSPSLSSDSSHHSRRDNHLDAKSPFPSPHASTRQHDPITTAINNEVEQQLGAGDAHVGNFFHLFSFL